jgi:hypothetical protein
MNLGRVVGIGIVGLIAFAVFGKSEQRTAQEQPASPTTSPAYSYGSVSSSDDSAVETAAEEIGSDSFEDHGDTGQCTQDCSGHEAGFQWAADHGITEPGDCGGRSQSFIEGCETYGEAVQERAHEIADDQESDGGQASK